MLKYYITTQLLKYALCFKHMENYPSVITQRVSVVKYFYLFYSFFFYGSHEGIISLLQ